MASTSEIVPISREVVSPPDANTLRILITTDNHLGFAEEDVYRREDSFRSFEECLRIAKDNNCDMVLLGGDFFHHNKPSRTTLLRATDLFREYCLGRKPVNIQLESDPKVHFADGMANYMDESINVELPVRLRPDMSRVFPVPNMIILTPITSPSLFEYRSLPSTATTMTPRACRRCPRCPSCTQRA